MWTTGDWGRCKNGQKTRSVGCQYLNGTKVSTDICSEKLQYVRVDKTACYDHIQKNPKTCPQNHTGYFCEIYTGNCADVTLEQGDYKRL